ncbi:hypothetical protein KIM372_01060 [Bombiscardovia nodaiensis]|uniref:Uncharacterized protein n=1 Tax=Bombiscardovia nodaiensis TaxID=2932181 RepID=A0ABM8B681_9BIFI|nr:hypothetical protein KIM372_01060 [Bombiscardovia nodaiensis]
MRQHSLTVWRQNRAKLLGLVSLAIAVAMVVALMPTAYADTYTGPDDFESGTQPLKAGKLTVSKRLSLKNGEKATGSAQDSTKASNGTQPGVGVTFRLTRVTPTGSLTPGQMKPNVQTTFTRDPNYVYEGKTNATGDIANGTAVQDGIWQWKKIDGSSSPAADFAWDSANTASYYYLLEEVTGAGQNKYTDPASPLYDPTYTVAEKSIFDLPYRATNTTTPAGGGASTSVDGFVYNVHVYPKNVNNSQILKKVTNVTDASGAARTGQVAQIGDRVFWEITQRLYDGKTAASSGDGKLDLSEINVAKTTSPSTVVMTIADRQPMRTKLSPGSAFITLTWIEDGSSKSLNLAASNGTGGWAASDYLDVTGGTYSWPNNNVKRSKNGPASLTGDILPPARDTVDNNHEFVSWGEIYELKAKVLDAMNYAPTHAYSDIELHIPYESRLTAPTGVHVNDAEAYPVGYLENTVASDNIDNYGRMSTFTATAALPSPGFQFVKTNLKDSAKDPTLKGAAEGIFRLTKYDASTQTVSKTEFLCDDNQFHPDKDANGVQIIQPDGTRGIHALEARSNQDGIVTFVGLPLFDGETVTADVSRLKFGVMEYKPAKYPNPNFDPGQPENAATNPRKLDYRSPSEAFGYIDFSGFAGKTRSDFASSNTPIAASLENLNFKDYATNNMPTDATSPFKDLKGNTIVSYKKPDNTLVTKGLVNWRQDQNDPAIVGALPLTGGPGIVTMLVAGLVIMLVGLAYGRLKQSQVTTSRPAHAAS